MKNFISKIDPKGAASLAVLFLALINQFLAVGGQSPLPISNDDLSGWVSTGLTGVVALYGWFSNRQLTKSAPDKTNVTSGDASQATKKGGEASEDTK